MTDGYDGSGQIPRRTQRVGEGAAPVSGALAIVLAVVAVVAGFLILRSISDSGSESADFPAPGGANQGGADDGDDPSSTTDPAESEPTTAPTTTLPQLVKTGASIVVANANGQDGSAGAMKQALAADGFVTVDPTNSSSSVGTIEVSVIYYDPAVPAAQDVANSLARTLGGVGSVSPMPETPQTRDGTLNGGNVLLMLGKDKAGKTLAELAPPAVPDDGVTTLTNPDPTG